MLWTLLIMSTAYIHSSQNESIIFGSITLTNFLNEQQSAGLSSSPAAEESHSEEMEEEEGTVVPGRVAAVVSHQPLSLSAPASPRQLELPPSLSSTLVGLGAVLGEQESEWASVASFPSDPFPPPANSSQQQPMMAELVDLSGDEEENEGPITLDCPSRPSRIFTISSRRPTEIRPTTC